MSDPADARRAYHTLDGLRGAAALIVVTRHAGAFMPSGLAPESFLAVDLFFLLSGFVVAHAYEARLAEGRLGFRTFLRTRLIRLYPLYALGLGLGLLAKLAEHGATAGWLAQAAAVGLLMAPAIPPLPMGSSALDGPTWTLLPEVLVNLAYAASLRWLKGAWLAAVIVAGAAGLVASERVYGSLDGGWSVERFPLVAARLAFSFFLGVAMFRRLPPRRIAPWGAWGAMAIAAAALTLDPGPALRPAFELVAVLALFPAAVALAVRCEPGPRSAPLFRALGVASYALYVLHQPLASLLAVYAQRVAWLAQPSWPAGLLFAAMAVALAFAADALYDRPVRRWLSGRARVPLHPAPPVAARPTAALGGG